LGKWLPAYTKRPKRRVITSPKFYFSDVGVVNFLAKRGPLVPGSALFGKAFENWCHHELFAYNSYSESFATLSYWRLPSGIEVDFIINNMEVAIEAKSVQKITADHLKGLWRIKEDHPNLKRKIVVCLENKRRITADGVEVVPVNDFARMLWDGDIF
jgi:predicted AAA+ superfamily ATPase